MSGTLLQDTRKLQMMTIMLLALVFHEIHVTFYAEQIKDLLEKKISALDILLKQLFLTGF